MVMAKKQSYQLIVFDWDGTLMDSSKKIGNCFESAAMAAGMPSPNVDQVISYIGLGLDESFRRLYPGIDQQSISQLVNSYRESWLFQDNTPMALFKDVNNGLKKLKNAGYMLAIATGKSRRGLDQALMETNLESMFVYSRCADETRSKPHPQMLLDVLEFTGLESSACVMVGDTTFDLEMAKNADMDGIGVGYGSHPEALLEPLSVGSVFAGFNQLVDYFG